jgi:hypothetical protein
LSTPPKDGALMMTAGHSKRSLLPLLALLAIALAGCATRQPPVAAMVAQSITGDYGYSDKALAPDRYQVTFVSPQLRATRDPDQNHGLDTERQRVYDLALWRAAQLAVEKGYPAFKVEQESRDVNVAVNTYYPPPAPLFGPFGSWYWPYGYGNWPGYYGYDPYYYGYRSRAAGRITVNLIVAMLQQPTDGSLDAVATVERLRKAYGSATFQYTQAQRY